MGASGFRRIITLKLSQKHLLYLVWVNFGSRHRAVVGPWGFGSDDYRPFTYGHFFPRQASAAARLATNKCPGPGLGAGSDLSAPERPLHHASRPAVRDTPSQIFYTCLQFRLLRLAALNDELLQRVLLDASGIQYA